MIKEGKVGIRAKWRRVDLLKGNKVKGRHTST
jgi:hypothetical protein